MAQVSFKDRLKKGPSALGCLANMGSAIAAEILAASGYDSVMVDLEHGPGDILNAIHQMQAITAGGAVPLLRVPDNDPVWLKRALDSGPAGIMVPAIGTVDAARAAVTACRYPPEGIRGVAHSIARASGYGTNLTDYLERGLTDFLLIAQIETMEGLDNVEAIAAVDGIDMLFVGPMDLSASAGYFNQPDHPDMENLLTRIEQAAKAQGKYLGALATPGRPAEALFKRCYHFVLDSVDIAILRDAALEKVAACRKYTK